MFFTWSIDKITTMPQCGELVNVVTDAEWRCTVSEGETSRSSYGKVTLGVHDEESFTPYQDLTEAEVIDWVKAALGEEGVIHNQLVAERHLLQALNPTKQETALPW